MASTARARLALLGPVVITAADGSDVPLGGLRQRAVLGWLALRHPRPSTTSEIIDAVWGEDPPATARNTVQVYVSALRKALRPLGADVTRTGDAYLLAAGPLAVDGVDFEAACAAGRVALRTGEPARSVDRLTEAVALWRGTPFAGMDDVPYVGPARVPLASTMLGARLDLIDALLRLGRAEDAVASGERLVADHPFDERAWALLATAHHRAGRQSAALDTLRSARRTLADELGLDPGADLVTLEAQILAGTVPEPEPPAPSDPAPESEPAATPRIPLPPLPAGFTGRSEILDDLVGRIGTGQRHVNLVGMGGIGKTTLALGLAHRLEADGTRVVVAELDGVLDAELATDRIARAWGISDADDPLTAIGTAIGDSPAVLIADNVEQLVDAAQVVESVLAAAPGLVVVTTSRCALQNRSEYMLPVPPLAAASAVDLFLMHVARVRPQLTSVDPAVAAELCESLGGIPLGIGLAAERVRSLTPAQLLERTKRAAVSLIDVTGSTMPARQHSLRLVIEGALGTLDHPARELLRRLSVVDGWVPLELAEALGAKGEDPGDPLDALDTAVAAQLLELSDTGRYRLIPPVRSHLREIDGRDEDLDDLLAAVEDVAATCGPAMVGPESVTAAGTMEDWHDALTSVLTRATGPAAERAGAVLLLTHRYWLLMSRLAEGCRWSELLADRVGLSDDIRVRMTVLAGTQAIYVNRTSGAEVLRRGLAEAAALDLAPDRVLVNGWCSLGAVAAIQGQDHQEAARCGQQARVLAAASGNAELIALARDFVGFAASHAGDRLTAHAVAMEGITDARASGDRHDLLMLLLAASEELLHLGRTDESWVLIEEAFELAASFPPGTQLCRVLLFRSVGLLATDRWTAAVGHTTELLALTAERFPDAFTVGDALGVMAAATACLGRHEEAATLWGAADQVLRDIGMQDVRDRQPPVVEQSRVATESVLGGEANDRLLAVGAANPQRLIDRILADHKA
ncbi:hypothetical protein GIS00_06445 [Nakamurella sp. YIM 132087]|uniref:OmpR/PhoB-type domain-containing protein n=1 Tax=Nakamurella alba TaxID=2665158 RepID=A0A7K1FK09_9ACTN|nr:BTAD domain-containing putative transcriptional regulator [Nakamurella alba]MTD13583.1 hypothetical protein [Nakamurella alba]